jgi:hypothetical protein
MDGCTEAHGHGLLTAVTNTQITTFNNETYATETTAPEFTVTWQYPQGPESQPVHAFPNIRLEGSVLPATLQTLSQMYLELEWSYAVGNEPAASTDAQALTGVDLNGNVAIDMFIDSDKTSAQDSNKAKYEVMVWFADFGAAAQPIGQAKGVAATHQVNGTTLFVIPQFSPCNFLFLRVFHFSSLRIRIFVLFSILVTLCELTYFPQTAASTPARTDSARTS